MLENNTPKSLLTTTTVTGILKCPIDRAFKTPMLGDATKILIGFGGIQLISGFAKDETWGVAGGSRVPIAKRFLILNPGEFGLDQIFVRDENKYWKWGVSQFRPALFFAIENCGEWWVADNNNGTISATWKYTWYSRNILTHPINWLFVKIFWRQIMKNGMDSIKQMAEAETPYVYDG
jgi:hypothetical protein